MKEQEIQNRVLTPKRAQNTANIRLYALNEGTGSYSKRQLCPVVTIGTIREYKSISELERKQGLAEMGNKVHNQDIAKIYGN